MGDQLFQRIGAISNAHAGADFVLLGAHNRKKHRRFDLGCGAGRPTLIECKSHKWAAGNNIPSAKLTVWNESMHYFHLAPDTYLGRDMGI